MTRPKLAQVFARTSNAKKAPAVRSIHILPQSRVSVCWTAWLIILTIAPNDTANYLMGTADFDDGHFWLIIDPEPEIMTVNTIVLVGVAASYIHVMLKMTVLRNSSLRIMPIGPRREEVSLIRAARLPHLGKYLQQAVSFWLELTGYYGHYRKFWNVLFKVGDLLVESIQLDRLLEAGFSTHSAFTEVLVDTVFDMIFAVGYPIFLLGYSYSMFDLDRGIARLNLTIYPTGSFQRDARMQADPIETTLFRFCFDSLRTLTWSSLLVRLVMNISFSYRLTRLVEVIYQRRKNMRTTSSKLAKLKAQLAVPRWIGALFVVASAFAMAYTAKCITESQKACHAYPQCVAFAYRWDRQDASLYYTGVEVIPDWLKVFHKLEFINMEGKFGETNVVRIPPDAFSRMSSLTFIHFGYLENLSELPSFKALGPLLDLVSPIDERPLSLFQGSVKNT
ncbi:uncharacterized protein IUM83_16746 [Phytophthora cinnamomi]|uniref:uncharacterized protein n=1 Tax=Phytophthora cinnamomi TaxID=4785 RepID=UPI0035596673|nr:hypothetical protein IUM83_16746 [Phytophthora cinnamomi]